MDKIFEIFRNIRKEKNFSQEEMSKKLFIAKETYRDIENGRIKLTLENYLKICSILEIDPIQLVKGTI